MTEQEKEDWTIDELGDDHIVLNDGEVIKFAKLAFVVDDLRKSLSLSPENKKVLKQATMIFEALS